MFKRQLLRQAQVCRGLRASPSSILASGSGLAPRSATTYRPAILAASFSRQIIQRSYSSATAAAATQSDNGGQSNGLITRFADLSSLGVHENLIRAITEGLGYEKMTDVQSMSINPALQGKDLVAQARTGTGKTLGFLLPTLQKIISASPELAERPRSTRFTRPDAKDIRGIIISPTRELAEQISAEAQKLCRATGIKVQTAVGGLNKREMLRKTRMEGCHLLVGTPGRLLDLLSDEMSGIAAPRLDALILDEADRLIEVGFEKELQDIVGLLPDRREKSRQTLLFSATIPKNVVSVARSYIDPSNFQFVQTINAEEAPTHEKVPQHIVTVPGFEHWVPALLEVAEKARDLEQPFKAIAFFNNTVAVKMMGELFQNLRDSIEVQPPPTYVIHSDLDQRQRTRAADNFRKARSALLISTDVTARGMDFPNVTHVLQFGVPTNRDQYIHRLGRTGRADKSGVGYLIIQKTELGNARDTLPGLPIKRNDELEVAKVDTQNKSVDELSKYFVAVNRAMLRVSRFHIEETYRKLISGNMPHMRGFADRQGLVDAVNHWATFQGQLRALPSVQFKQLGRNSRGLEGLNVADGEQRGNDGRQQGGFGGRGPSDDPFASISQDSGRSRGGFGGNRGGSRGGFGGDRGGSRGGFGGDRGGSRGGFGDRGRTNRGFGDRGRTNRGFGDRGRSSGRSFF